jgi:hypothetical protein
MKKELLLHVIEKKTGKMLAMPLAHQVPAVGEEIRLSGERYYKVVQVVHVFDESCPHHRANIGVEPA